MNASRYTPRPDLVLDTFVELTDTLASDYDVGELLQFLVDRCAHLLSADIAGVLLEAPEGQLGLAAATTAEMRTIEEVEIAADDGPCMMAYRTGQPVTADDLDECRDRWPNVAWRLLELGLRSGYAFPLRLREDRIGALNLYGYEPGRLSEDSIRLGQAFADVAAIGILQQRRIAAAEERAVHLSMRSTRASSSSRRRAGSHSTSARARTRPSTSCAATRGGTVCACGPSARTWWTARSMTSASVPPTIGEKGHRQGGEAA